MSVSALFKVGTRTLLRPTYLPGQWSYARLLKSRVKLMYRALVGSKLYERLEFRRHLGYWPNLDTPQTFNERICARKFRSFPEAPMLADKLAVREYVSARVGRSVLSRLYYGGNSPEDVDFELLPPKFVMKGTHGSGPDLRAFIWDKSAVSQRHFIKLGRRLLRRRCGPEVNEWWYSQIPPNLLVEEMLLDQNGSIPLDFKVYVFNGVSRYVQVIDGRHGMPKSGFYDIEWRPQPFTREQFPRDLAFPPPANLREMVSVADALAAGLEFVRVDLYSVKDRVVFGEMTLAPGAGWVPFRPRAYDLALGKHWRDPRSQVDSGK